MTVVTGTEPFVLTRETRLPYFYVEEAYDMRVVRDIIYRQLVFVVLFFND